LYPLDNHASCIEGYRSHQGYWQCIAPSLKVHAYDSDDPAGGLPCPKVQGTKPAALSSALETYLHQCTWQSAGNCSKLQESGGGKVQTLTLPIRLSALRLRQWSGSPIRVSSGSGSSRPSQSMSLSHTINGVREES
jgi:hypothetical protein